MAALATWLRLASSRLLSMITSADPMPRVSVLLAAYNSENCLEATVASVLRQSFTDFELIIVDDGSVDGTTSLALRLMAVDPRVRLILQENRGLSASRNRGFLEARGDLIAFLDHDDLWHPAKLAQQVARLDANPTVGVVSCFSAILDERHRCTGWRLGGMAEGNVLEEMLEWDMISGGSVVLVRRQALTAAGPFDTGMALREDWDMWIRLARQEQFTTVPRVLVGYVRGSGNASLDCRGLELEGRRVLTKARRTPPGFSRRRLLYLLARDRFAIACFATIDGRIGEAWRHLGRSIRLTPAPLMRSPRRLALVAVLILRTLLPSAAFLQVMTGLNRFSFDVPPGLPFADLPSREEP